MAKPFSVVNRVGKKNYNGDEIRRRREGGIRPRSYPDKICRCRIRSLAVIDRLVVEAAKTAPADYVPICCGWDI
jgi:hypothetical protein